jgi:hypothetical protein
MTEGKDRASGERRFLGTGAASGSAEVAWRSRARERIASSTRWPVLRQPGDLHHEEAVEEHEEDPFPA